MLSSMFIFDSAATKDFKIRSLKNSIECLKNSTLFLIYSRWTAIPRDESESVDSIPIWLSQNILKLRPSSQMLPWPVEDNESLSANVNDHWKHFRTVLGKKGRRENYIFWSENGWPKFGEYPLSRAIVEAKCSHGWVFCPPRSHWPSNSILQQYFNVGN